jgi:hypothetical protein
MSESDRLRAIHYQLYAKALHFIADRTDHEEHRAALRRAAEHFNALAESIEWQEWADKE